MALTDIDRVLTALHDQLLADDTLGYQGVFLVDGIVEGVYPQVTAVARLVTFAFDSQQRDLATALVTVRLTNQYADAEDGERRIRILGDVLRWWLIRHRFLGSGTPQVNLLQGSRVRQIEYRTVAVDATDWLHVAELTWWCQFFIDSTKPPVVPPPDPGPPPVDPSVVVQRIIRIGPKPPATKPAAETIEDPPPP